MFYLICHENKLNIVRNISLGFANRTEVLGLLLEKMNSSRRFI